jgi:hypothetical protein
MTGGEGGNNITIQINVSKGGDDQQTTGADYSGVWNKLANRVKSVVREELVNNQRPGGLLYK